MPWSVSHFSALVSVWFDTMKSRQASAAATSTSALAAASLRFVHGLARAQQGLGRDARPVGALATDELAFDDGDAQTALGQRAGAVLAGRAGAEDDDVVVGHAGGSAPVCSATMYAAYQAGQSASPSPVRFSCSPCAAAARLSASRELRRRS